jgi:ERCC4-related helicase
MVSNVVDVIRASSRAFIGQGGSGKKGESGMKQKEQKAVLQNFRDGVFNTLVATCIGEEGLDIPAVDLIVCYGGASPTRNIQRMGRTGRHKEGRVVYILAQGKEEADFNKTEEVRLCI